MVRGRILGEFGDRTGVYERPGNSLLSASLVLARPTLGTRQFWKVAGSASLLSAPLVRGQ